MDLKIIREVNDLWGKIYPYLAAHVMEYYGKAHGNVLELGPFAGGISVELARRYPGLRITLAAQEPGIAGLLRGEMAGAGLDQEIEVACRRLDDLDFAGSLFDLVIFRGAYFFLDADAKIIREIYRVLRKEGIAFIGGGYGKVTPQPLIEEIADKSRDLNDRLGRKMVTVGEVKDMVKKAGLSAHAKIEEEGGLWLVLKKSGE